MFIFVLSNQNYMHKHEREKRNASIKETYKIKMDGKEYNPSERKQSGSSYVIQTIAKRFKLTESAIYQILKK